MKNWTVVWDPEAENWIVNWIENWTGPAEKLDGPCGKLDGPYGKIGRSRKIGRARG